MHEAVAVAKGIYWVGVNDHETDLFEAYWPLPRGVSYNSYLVVGDEALLVDTVKSSFFGELMDKVRSVLGGRPLSYVVVNHMEPDHSGSAKMLKALYPGLKFVGNSKTLEMLKSFYGLGERDVLVVKDGDRLDLGGGHSLSFHTIPMVHWPETMATYHEGEGVLFSCDAFGGFGCLDGGIFDDEVDMEYYEDEILRYFSNIVGRYSKPVKAAIEKLSSLRIRVVAPSHGPIHRRRPNSIVERYLRWSEHRTECGAVVVYGSMYGNTRKAAEAVARTLAEEGIERIVVHDASRVHSSFVVKDIWRFKALVLASCTYNAEIFPPVRELLGHLANKKMEGRLLGLVGCYTWSPGIVSQMKEVLTKSGSWELVEPSFEFKSSPSAEDLDRCREMGRRMAQLLKTCQY